MEEKPCLILCLLCLFALIPGCETTSPEVKLSASHIEKSLPQSKLAYFNDNFDKMREDIWEKSALIHSKRQLSKFKLADIRIENGKLRIKTKTGGFSEAGLVLKYVFRGDFDVQVDCHIDLLGEIHDMDQVVVFGAVEKGVDLKSFNSTELAVFKKGEWKRGVIYSYQRKSGEMHKGKWHKVDSFHGTFRIIRKGNKARTLYRLEGKPKWKTLDTFGFTTNDVLVGFFLQNYVLNRTSTTAESSITALFDNFRINAAQDIIEEEI